jgi:hypothetical protein
VAPATAIFLRAFMTAAPDARVRVLVTSPRFRRSSLLTPGDERM